MDEVTQAYRTKATELADLLGTVVSPQDPGRGVVESWAKTVSGRILDLGAGTGRWSGHLAALGHDIEGLEPVGRFVELARRAHPAVPFRHASLAELMGTDERWSGVLAWYSLIHLSPDELPTALSPCTASSKTAAHSSSRSSPGLASKRSSTQPRRPTDGR